jgi:hypothetical protein
MSGMAEEPENLTLRFLQEFRHEMQEMRRDLTTRVDGLTIMVGMVIGMVTDHDDRIEKLEARH